jgi:hypothetical protein
MSVHIFDGIYEKRPVAVQIGWDEPLQHYFMTVTRARTDGRVGTVIYSNLSDPEIDGGASDPAHFWKKLAALGVECKLQSEIDGALRSEAASNVGNRIVRYGPGGVVEEK